MTEVNIVEGFDATNFGRVHSWLTATYWSPAITMDTVRRAAEGSSLVINAYLDQTQIGYLRVVSDRATFAWICDVFVDPAHRGKGVARQMVHHALAHPHHQGLRRWLLATLDAHGVYAAAGFKPLNNPERWMEIRATNAGC